MPQTPAKLLMGGWLLFFGTAFGTQTKPLAYSPSLEKQQAYDQLLEKFYAHFQETTVNREIKESLEELIRQCPDEPYFYEFWAATEWALLGHELKLKLGENKDIAAETLWQARVKKYEIFTQKGLGLTENAEEELNTKLLFARAALRFERAKFFARFHGGKERLIQTDKETAEAIKTLGLILDSLPHFCPAYFFLGGTQYQLISNVENSSALKRPLKRQMIRWFSKTYKELGKRGLEVFDFRQALEQLEKNYACGYQEWWFKKSWIENGFLLIDAYQNSSRNLSPPELMMMMELKELPLIKKMVQMFPENAILVKMLMEKTARYQALKDYLTK